MASGPNGAAQLRVQRLDSIRGVDDPPHALAGKAKNGITSFQLRRQLCAMAGYFVAAPRALPAKASRAAWPAAAAGRAVDGPRSVRARLLRSFPGGKIHRVADEGYDASLNDGLW